MSYRREQTKKGRRAKTPKRLRQIYTRDLHWCWRWGIPLDEAWKWNRFPLEDYRP